MMTRLDSKEKYLVSFEVLEGEYPELDFLFQDLLQLAYNVPLIKECLIANYVHSDFIDEESGYVNRKIAKIHSLKVQAFAENDVLYLSITAIVDIHPESEESFKTRIEKSFKSARDLEKRKADLVLEMGILDNRLNQLIREMEPRVVELEVKQYSNPEDLSTNYREYTDTVMVSSARELITVIRQILLSNGTSGDAEVKVNDYLCLISVVNKRFRYYMGRQTDLSDGSIDLESDETAIVNKLEELFKDDD
jgi:hypothetical protein